MSYSYDLAGRRTAVSDTSAAIASVAMPGSTTTYTTTTSYDALNRPVTVGWSPVPAAATAALTTPVSFAHTYNAVNQRIGQTASDNSWIGYPSGTSTTAYTANALNQYTSVGATTPTYNANGNLTFDGTYTLAYDIENRLTSASATGMTASYAFDGRGRRKLKTVNGTTTITITDADNRAVLDYDGSSGAVLRWYAYGLGSNNLLNQIDVGAGTRATLIQDMLGSIVGSIDSGTGTVSAFGYRPYGSSGSPPSTFGYTGQQVDPETGYYYFRARNYHPGWGRFPQTDPVGFGGGLHLYAYVSNDPLNLIDPTGRDCATLNGSISCSSSNYQFTIPVATSPLLWPFNGTDAVNFKSTDPGYHAYSTPANNGNAINASVGAANNYIVNNPVPGTSNPASSAGTANDATPVFGNNYAVISPVISYTATNDLNGKPIVVNITLPTHPLYPGIVVREIDTDADGGTIINNWGEGTSLLQDSNSGWGIASKYINGVWNDLYPPNK